MRIAGEPSTHHKSFAQDGHQGLHIGLLTGKKKPPFEKRGFIGNLSHPMGGFYF
jgi:hypothetical protein